MNTSGAELLPPTLLNVVNTHLHYSMGEGRGEGGTSPGLIPHLKINIC